MASLNRPTIQQYLKDVNENEKVKAKTNKSQEQLTSVWTDAKKLLFRLCFY